MHVEYVTVIAETETELRRVEKANRSKKILPRIQMLRLFKTEKAKTQPECARMLGFSLVQIERWWACYCQRGLSGLLELKKHAGGRASHMTPDAWKGLEDKMLKGEIPHLKDAQNYLKNAFHIQFSVSWIGEIFHKRRVKLKTGRPRHRKVDPQAQSDFKKKFPAEHRLL